MFNLETAIWFSFFFFYVFNFRGFTRNYFQFYKLLNPACDRSFPSPSRWAGLWAGGTGRRGGRGSTWPGPSPPTCRSWRGGSARSSPPRASRPRVPDPHGRGAGGKPGGERDTEQDSNDNVSGDERTELGDYGPDLFFLVFFWERPVLIWF